MAIQPPGGSITGQGRMNLAISTVEIAVLIVLPLVIFINRSGMPVPRRVPWLILLYLVWYLSYSPFHEFSHYVPAKLMGLEVQDSRFFPAIWKGEFAGGFVRTVYENSLQEFVVDLIPYVRDVVLVACGCAIIRWSLVKRIIPTALVLLLLVLSPVYDVFDNYFAYCRGNLNDYWGMSHHVGVPFVHALGAGLAILCLLGGVIALRDSFKMSAWSSGERTVLPPDGRV